MNQLQDKYEMNQATVAETLFLTRNTVSNIEKRALEKLKKALEERGILSAQDILED
jgi:transcriptional regulator